MIYRKIIDIWAKHTLFYCTSGYLGAVGGALPGDLVCVLFGCNFPVLLRYEEDHHIYVGPCYVIGLMDREAMSEIKTGKLQQRECEIR